MASKARNISCIHVVTDFPGDNDTVHEEVLEPEVLSCAICFEDAEAILLPCACNVTYCAQCWDHALAQSFNVSGDAMCPTCRAPIAIEFDADKLQLVFSRKQESSLQVDVHCSVNASRQSKRSEQIEVITKLRQQALPAQVRLLQAHGKHHPDLMMNALAAAAPPLQGMLVAALKHNIQALDECSDWLSKDRLVNCLFRESLEKRKMWRLLGENFAAATDEMPACVCGSSLVNVSGEERIMRHFDQLGYPRDSVEYRRMLSQVLVKARECESVISCDLCEQPVPRTDSIWTCKNSHMTMLHPTSYDICNDCFMVHAACTEASMNALIRVACADTSCCI